MLVKVRLIIGQGLVSPDLLVMEELVGFLALQNCFCRNIHAVLGKQACGRALPGHSLLGDSEDSEATQSHSTITAAVNMADTHVDTI